MWPAVAQLLYTSVCVVHALVMHVVGLPPPPRTARTDCSPECCVCVCVCESRTFTKLAPHTLFESSSRTCVTKPHSQKRSKKDLSLGYVFPFLNNLYFFKYSAFSVKTHKILFFPPNTGLYSFEIILTSNYERQHFLEKKCQTLWPKHMHMNP